MRHDQTTVSIRGPGSKLMGMWPATGLVIMSMLGTGAFSTSGILLSKFPSEPMIIATWIAAGLIALCGALTYGELVTMYPENGGDYMFLRRIFHPAVGFVAGFTSFIVGFSVPIAVAALAFGAYLSAIFPGIPPIFSAWLLVVVLSSLHVWRFSIATSTQKVMTGAKVLLMIVFIVASIAAPPKPSFEPNPVIMAQAITAPAFAWALAVVMFSYSGWSAAVYVAGELRNAARALPIALITGTLLLLILYSALNIGLLRVVPAKQLSGVVEVGHVAALRLFGPRWGIVASCAITLGLVSTVGSIVTAGPRVYEAMGHDYPALRFLTVRLRFGGPALAIAFQAAVSLVFIVTSTFERLMAYVGFTISALTTVTALGLFVLRRRAPKAQRQYRVWGYPVTPILFIAANLWMIYFSLVAEPAVAIAGVVMVFCGLVLYLFVRKQQVRTSTFVAPLPSLTYD